MDTIAHFWDRLAQTPPLARDDLHLVLAVPGDDSTKSANDVTPYGAMLYVPKAHRADVLAASAEAAGAMCDYLENWWAKSQEQANPPAPAPDTLPPLPINYVTGLADGIAAMTPRLLTMVNRKTPARKTVNVMMTLPAQQAAALCGRVRLARDGDEPVLNRWRKLYNQERGILFDADVDAWIESRNVYVHEANGVIVALAKFDLVLPTAVEIGGVYTFPEYRKQGFGAELIHDLVCRIRQMGKTPLLQVDTANGPALALYRKMNWVELGQLTRVWLSSIS
jgi:GNAT superfamily N-acetyltransferase